MAETVGRRPFTSVAAAAMRGAGSGLDTEIAEIVARGTFAGQGSARPRTAPVIGEKRSLRRKISKLGQKRRDVCRAGGMGHEGAVEIHTALFRSTHDPNYGSVHLSRLGGDSVRSEFHCCG